MKYVVCLFTVVSLFGAYGIRLDLHSPLVQETAVGTIVTAAFTVTNTLDTQENFIIRLKLPEGWVLLPFEEPFISLQPQETKVQLLAFRVPLDAKAAQYEISYEVQGMEHPSLLSSQTFFVQVLAKNEMQNHILFSPKTAVAGKPYKVELKTVNSGNVDLPVKIDVATTEESVCRPLSSLQFTLEPGKERVSSFEITGSSQLDHQVACVTYFDVKADLLTMHLSAETDVFPLDSKKVDCYRYLPMKTTFGYGMKNHAKQLFVEQYGQGPIDESKKKTSNFSFERQLLVKQMWIVILEDFLKMGMFTILMR